jgi:peptide/nickel transport system ATP-binding protein
MTVPATQTLALEGVSFRYGARGWFRGATPPTVLEDVSFELRSSFTTGLVGESGSGKSTIAKLLLGLLVPTEGQVRLNGQPLQTLSRLERARTIQMVFQDPYSCLNPRATLAEILSLPLRTHRIGDAAQQDKAVRATMDAVGLSAGFRDRLPRELSGGQRQRVAIARALMLRPKLLLCDEPTSALDVSVQSQILNLLLDLQQEFGLGYLFISHNLAVVQHVSDDILVIQSGRIVERGPAQQVYFRPTHPYSQQLVGSTLSLP